MYCRKCGRKIPDDSSFCSFCGEKIITEDDNTNLISASDLDDNSISRQEHLTAPENGNITINSENSIARFKCSVCGKACNHVVTIDGFNFCDLCKNNYTLLLENHSVIAQYYFNNIVNDEMSPGLKHKLLGLMTSNNNSCNDNPRSNTDYKPNIIPGINTIYTQNNLSKTHLKIAIALIASVIVIFGFAGITSEKEVKEKIAEDEAFDANLNEYKAYNGQIFVNPGYERVCPLTINTSGTYDYYVYLDYKGSPDYSTMSRESDDTSNYESDMSFYIKGGESLDIDVPIGEYDFYYCSGKNFYGPKDKFGSSSNYYKADQVFSFYTDDEYYQGASVTLYPVPNGNMDTVSINADEFPE